MSFAYLHFITQNAGVGAGRDLADHILKYVSYFPQKLGDNLYDQSLFSWEKKKREKYQFVLS